jgi:hypothetical protein
VQPGAFDRVGEWPGQRGAVLLKLVNGRGDQAGGTVLKREDQSSTSSTSTTVQATSSL